MQRGVQEMNKTRVWGIIKHELGYAVPYVYVLLLRKIQHNKHKNYKIIDRSYTDENGYYSFYVSNERESIYKVVVVWTL